MQPNNNTKFTKSTSYNQPNLQMINEKKYDSLRGMYEYVGFNDSLIGLLFSRFYDKMKAAKMAANFKRKQKDLDKYVKELNLLFQEGMDSAIENEKGVKLYGIYNLVNIYIKYVSNNPEITTKEAIKRANQVINDIDSSLKDLDSRENISEASDLLEKMHELVDSLGGKKNTNIEPEQEDEGEEIVAEEPKAEEAPVADTPKSDIDHSKFGFDDSYSFRFNENTEDNNSNTNSVSLDTTNGEFTIDMSNVAILPDDNGLVLYPAVYVETGKERQLFLKTVHKVNGQPVTGSIEYKLVMLADLTNDSYFEKKALEYVKNVLGKDFSNFHEARDFVMEIDNDVSKTGVDTSDKSLSQVTAEVPRNKITSKTLADFIRTNSGAKVVDTDNKAKGNESAKYDFTGKSFENRIFSVNFNDSHFFIKVIGYDKNTNTNLFKMSMYMKGNRENIFEFLRGNIFEEADGDINDKLSDTVFSIGSLKESDLKIMKYFTILSDTQADKINADTKPRDEDETEQTPTPQPVQDTDTETDNGNGSDSESGEESETTESTGEHEVIKEKVSLIFNSVDFEDLLKGFKAREIEFISLLKRNKEKSIKLIDPFKVAKVFIEANYIFTVPNFKATVTNKYALKYFNTVGDMGVFIDGAKYWNIQVMNLLSIYKEYIPDTLGKFIAELLDTNILYSYQGNGNGSVAGLINRYFERNGISGAALNVPQRTSDNKDLIDGIENSEKKIKTAKKSTNTTNFVIEKNKNNFYLLKGTFLNATTNQKVDNVKFGVATIYYEGEKQPLTTMLVSPNNIEFFTQIQNIELPTDASKFVSKDNTRKVSLCIAYNDGQSIQQIFNTGAKITKPKDNLLHFYKLNENKEWDRCEFYIQEVEVITNLETNSPVAITGNVDPSKIQTAYNKGLTLKTALDNLRKMTENKPQQ